ncbi:hypothetical protein FHU33_1056 [Blastococcus colisei]|uniref:Uncharacterized protein n=1 Tax=Blastococcus colisei TaxID=1564162 RepID=A0A543PC95_9ACTN|nr:hypothetical protein [Blastococcus colisei]TQN41679.1 hypothetical protein FHU33_1056 [Blastococcus colisei]
MSRLKAGILAGLMAIALAIPLGLGAFFIALAMFFEQGGTLGGFGASASENFRPRLWPTVISYGALVSAILIDVTAGLLTYRNLRRPQSSRR